MNSWLRSLGVMSFVLLSACSTTRVQHSERNGLFDEMADTVARQSGGAPAAREVAAADSPAVYDAAEAEAESTVTAPVKSGNLMLSWPIKDGTVNSAFGKRGRRKDDVHEGVDIKAPIGTPVLAAGDGTVLFSGSRLRGYGKMVVIRHDTPGKSGNLSTVYAHNSELRVIVGQRVKRGQLIALSGRSGHVTGPHLHFEVRMGTTPLNPESVVARGIALEDVKLDSAAPPTAETGVPFKKRHVPARKVAVRSAKKPRLVASARTGKKIAAPAAKAPKRKRGPAAPARRKPTQTAPAKGVAESV